MTSRAAELIRAGELVAFPTETVYGLGANALDPAAIEKIYVAKGRPPESPLIVHVSSIEMARGLVREWPEHAEKLARKFWPGPLTLVLPKQPHVPDRLTAGLDTVGIRMPAHPIALELIRESGVPIAAPSANRFTELSPTTAQHVRDGLGDRVAMILDGGRTTVGIESTVLSLAGPDAVLLRPGMVTQQEIEAVIGPVRALAAAPEGSAFVARPASPALQPQDSADLDRSGNSFLPSAAESASRCRPIRANTPRCCMNDCTKPTHKAGTGSRSSSRHAGKNGRPFAIAWKGLLSGRSRPTASSPWRPAVCENACW